MSCSIICRRHADLPAFDILDKGGFPNVKSAIGPEIKVSGRTALGILVDANRHPARRWAAVTHQLRQAVAQAPTQMAATGTVVEGRPRTGVWLMPDNASAGELEDFIERLITPRRPRLADGAALYRRHPDGPAQVLTRQGPAGQDSRLAGGSCGAAEDGCRHRRRRPGCDSAARGTVHRLGSSSVRLSDRHLERRIRLAASDDRA